MTIQAQILELLAGLARETGTAILLITHDLGVVNELADRVAVMYAGRIVEEGTRASVLGARAPSLHAGAAALDARRAPAPGARLAEIPGVVPAPDAWPAGCRFADRCAIAMEVCRAREPERTLLGAGAAVRCHAVAAESPR